MDSRTWIPNLRSDDNIHFWRVLVDIPYWDDTKDVIPWFLGLAGVQDGVVLKFCLILRADLDVKFDCS
jgi:hypothetical protein